METIAMIGSIVRGAITIMCMTLSIHSFDQEGGQALGWIMATAALLTGLSSLSFMMIL